MLYAVLLFLHVLCCGGFVLDGLSGPANLYVSTHGRDHNNGHDIHHPVRTLSQALSQLKLSTYSNRDVTINLMQGYHDLDATVHITHRSPHTITIQAHKDEEVHVTGGKRIPSNMFHKVTDTAILHRLPPESRHKVYQMNLSDVGITDLGHLTSYGFYHNREAPLEVFYNGAPLRLARWPNEGFINIRQVLSGTHGRRFSYDSERPKRWSSENDLWAYGYWFWSWADMGVKIHSLDVTNHLVELERDTWYGLKEGHYNNQSNEGIKFSQQGGYFRFLNVLGEIDEPGEYYIDRSSGVLYLWPPTSSGHLSSHDVIYTSIINDCFSLDGTSTNVVFRGFTLEACRRFGIKGNNAHNVTVEQMEIKNTGSYNVFFSGDSRDVTISRCNLHDGDGGVSLDGGDRVTLTPSGNLVTDNLIWRFSRETGVGANALSLRGVAARVQYNDMHTGQYTAIRWSGNDHVMEYNNVHHTCQNSSDCGGIHSGRDWTARGNIIRKNHIHHTLRRVPGADVRGIMLDDQYSSVTIEENVFYDNEVHTNIGGGRDNIIRDNVFYNATLNAMQVDHRGTAHSVDTTLYDKLQKVPFKTGIWASKYPKLAVIESNSPSEPRGNQIYNNVFYGAKTSSIRGLVQNVDWFNVSNNAYSDLTSDFYDVTVRDFRPQCQLAQFAHRVHFPTPIQLNQVGPRFAVGPKYNEHVAAAPVTHSSPSPCTTYPPVTHVPKGSYLPDGSAPNTIHATPKQGCWLYVEKCASHPGLISRNKTHFYRDTNPGANTRQSLCLQRVSHYVSYCGAESLFHVIFGPTGAMTVGGHEGCYFAEYGCPDHSHSLPKVGLIHHDAYAEHSLNALHNEHNCLSRAFPQYRYCGSHVDYPYTSIFLPTGKTTTAGGGCWIQMDACVADSSIQLSFYDALGQTSSGSDNSQEICFNRAAYYWYHCGSHNTYPVTAFFRPQAASATYPPS